MSAEAPCILVTGGCGYIGSHTITVLLEKGYNVVVVDNFINSSKISLDRVALICKLSDEERKKRLICHEVDLCDEATLRIFFEESPKFASCIHFAGLKVLSTKDLLVLCESRLTQLTTDVPYCASRLSANQLVNH